MPPNRPVGAALPAACLFETASGGGPCLVNATLQGVVSGSRAVHRGQVEAPAPPQAIRIQISRDGRTVLNVRCNGALC